MDRNHMVKCSVTTCKYNDSNCCISKKINVTGEYATECQETVCDTFTTKSNVLTNALSSNDCSGETKIKCEATNCKYNEDKACSLNTIDVNCTCNSCQCESPQQTCCSSFEKLS